MLSFFFNEINFRTPRIISLFLRYAFKPWLRSISIVRNIIENRVFNSSRFNGLWNKESYRIEYMWNFKGKGFFNGCVCFAWSRNDQHCFCLKLFPLKLRHLFVKNSITLQLKTMGRSEAHFVTFKAPFLLCTVSIVHHF